MLIINSVSKPIFSRLHTQTHDILGQAGETNRSSTRASTKVSASFHFQAIIAAFIS